MNAHVRVAGWPNQRYALLFRYTEVKDHACHLIMVAAEDWTAGPRDARRAGPGFG